MNIIHIGNFTTGWDSSICDELHISNALEELGHKVVNIQREQWRERLAEDEKGVWHPHPKIILLAQWDGFSDDFIAHIRDLYDVVPIVYWCYDYQADGQEWHERLIKQSDLYLSKRIADSKYPNWQWFSQDFAPQFLKAYKEKPEKDIDVLFTGSYLPWATERNETLRAVNEKFNLVIHSVNSWPEEWGLDVRPPVMDEGLMDLIPRAKICLAIDHTIEAGYWSDRAAQYISCEAFVLHKYVPMLESRFHHNIFYFHNVEDCLEQIEFWIDKDEDRELIAAEAHDNSPYYKVKEKAADLLEAVERIL